MQSLVLLLERIAEALERIAGTQAESQGRLSGAPILAAKKLAGPAAQRWFEYLIDYNPSLRFVEDLTPAVILGVPGQYAKATLKNVEEALRKAIELNQ